MFAMVFDQAFDLRRLRANFCDRPLTGQTGLAHIHGYVLHMWWACIHMYDCAMLMR